jgi:stearoyl-CoA desaturase (Delta-9 desaturase)
VRSERLLAFTRWFDSDAQTQDSQDPTGDYHIDWTRCIPFLLMHLGCLGVFWVGTSPAAVTAAVFLYFSRMFFITGFYHRYFSHKTYRTSRAAQFLFAALGATAVQRGALWWAAHHRFHHKHSDRDEDIHSPEQHGFWWAHMGWIVTRKNFSTRTNLIADLTKYPELVFLNRYDSLVPLMTAGTLYAIGALLGRNFPASDASGPQMLVWGFFVSTVVLFHATCTINSLSHQFGTQRYPTGDKSKNNFFLALLTLGEGWHNNHHFYQSAARQGFYWWEIDISYYLLKLLSAAGVIRGLQPVPVRVREKRP